MTKPHGNRSVKCSDPCCPCHEWSARIPAESSALLERDAEYPVSEAKNVSSGQETLNSPIPALHTASTFDSEWASAPSVARRYTEQSMAEYWFLRGRQSEREKAVALLNQDLKELLRLAQLRIEQ